MRLMDRYKYKSFQASNDCFVYSYTMPAEIAIKDTVAHRSKKKRYHLNRFLRMKQAKTTNSTNTLKKYEITSHPVSRQQQKANEQKRKSRLSTFQLYDNDKILGSKKLKKMNCCTVSWVDWFSSFVPLFI